MSTNENTPISGQFWDWMQSYWHTNRSFPPAHPDWRKKADLVNGKVPAGQLPSYVDDVLEFNSYADLPQSGEKGKIYITTKDNKQFRWGGSAYIEINSGEKVESKIINGPYNANDLSKNSITYGYSVANAPSTVGAHSFTVLNLDTTNPDYKMQLGFDGDTNEMFSRNKSGGTWYDWKKIWNTGHFTQANVDSWNNMIYDYVTLGTPQNINARKSISGATGNSYNEVALEVRGNGSADTIFPALAFHQLGLYAATIQYRGNGFFFRNINNTSFEPVYSNAFRKDGSDDNYVLLGGGGHKAISDFATSTQLGNYLPLTGGSLSGPLSISTGGDAFFIQTSGSVVSASMYNSTADAIIRMQSKTNPFWDIRSSSDGSFTIQNNSQPKLVINSTNFDFNGSSLTNINRVKTNGDIKHNNLGLTLANNAAGGNFSSVLIKTGLTTGNMGTFTVKLYRYAHDYYEFNINNYKYNNSNYGTNVTWKAGNSQDITRIEFLKDSNNVLYVNVVIPLGYPRIAVTDFMAYSWDDVAFDSSNWGAEFDGSTSGLINEGQAIPSDFKRDNYLASSSSLQNYVTLDTPQTIIANKNFAQTSDVIFYGNENNEVTVWRNSTNAGIGGVVSGHILRWYGSRWKVGNARSGDSSSNGYAFYFSNDDGSTYSQKLLIGTDGALYLNGINSLAALGDNVSLGNSSLNYATIFANQEIYHVKNGITGTVLTSHNFNSDNYWKKFTSGAFTGVNSPNPFSFLNVDAAQKVYMGGLLVSNYYGDNVNIPANGAFILGLISTANDGNSAEWKQAHTWGNHAKAGYATTAQLANKVSSVNSTYSLDWDGFQTYLMRNGNHQGYLFHSGNLDISSYATQAWVNSNYFNKYFNKAPIDHIGASNNLNSLAQTGFYSIAYGTLNSGNYTGPRDGQRALLHFETENIYSASQIQTERYNGNIVSRTRADGGWSNWVRHWGDNDFTAADVSKWNNSLSTSSASEEVILEDDTLKIQPDEFSLEGSGAYDIGSRKKLVHVLFKEGTELNIRELVRRQTIVVFNFSKDRINLNVEGLRPYPLSPGMQVTLYISDEREVLLYNETGFKKLQ